MTSLQPINSYLCTVFMLTVFGLCWPWLILSPLIWITSFRAAAKWRWESHSMQWTLTPHWGPRNAPILTWSGLLGSALLSLSYLSEVIIWFHIVNVGGHVQKAISWCLTSALESLDAEAPSEVKIYRRIWSHIRKCIYVTEMAKMSQVSR